MFDLRQGTDTELKIGPFRSSADGSAQTALTIDIAGAGVELQIAKGAGDFADKNEGTVPAHEFGGVYRCLVNGSSDLATAGRLFLMCEKASSVAVWHEYNVLPKVVYDIKYGAFHGAGVLPSQAGLVAGTEVKLATGAPTEDDYYNGLSIAFSAGPGHNQVRFISGYAGLTRVCTIAPAIQEGVLTTTYYQIILP